jgi:prevent-host-death family protein
MTQFVSLSDAESWLSRLVDRAVAGEEIVITKNDVPYVRLVPMAFRGEPRRPANAMGIRRIATNFDAPDVAIERLFDGNEV